jgi:polygalacturonase
MLQHKKELVYTDGSVVASPHGSLITIENIIPFRKMFGICYFIAALTVVARAVTIDDFNSMKDVDTWEAASQNTQAMMNAITAANSSSTDKVVLIPAGSTYYMTQVKVEYLKDVTFQIDGTIRFSNEMDKYGDTQNDPFIDISQSEGIRIQGTGLLDGQGLNWWRRVSQTFYLREQILT